MILEYQDPERLARQAAIETKKNPNTTIDYLCRQVSKLDAPDPIKIKLCYAPDKLVISSEAFSKYLHNLNMPADLPLEALAHIILDDLNNELVPRWLQISLSTDNHKQDHGHKVLIEDRAPNWNNPNLLSRLPPF